MSSLFKVKETLPNYNKRGCSHSPACEDDVCRCDDYDKAMSELDSSEKERERDNYEPNL